ncbi:PREDICTED: D-aspartate oxidase isoform X3 [Cercocebus atys]|uniref:D-aspartate oxidase isoform X3 n=1 Tax=Cercocebus atys TaxID=9531 RepID=UPI0005F549DD|nr:PREDICTED: D-aspartate oxidase isoform X3 [Cercocebus atys]
MERKTRGNVLNQVTNGKQFRFPSVSGHETSQALQNKFWCQRLWWLPRLLFQRQAHGHSTDCSCRGRCGGALHSCVYLQTGAPVLRYHHFRQVYSRYHQRCGSRNAYSSHLSSSALMLLFLLPCEEGLVCFPFHHDYTPIHMQKQWFRETFNHLFAIANSAEAGDAGVHLVSGIKGSGGWMLTRRIDDLWELYPSFDIVVNCSGLGSRQLAGDSKIFPVRGQVLQVQAPWVEHFIRDGSGLTYIYPGTSHVTLGGTRQKGDWNLSPDAENSREILSRCCALEPSLHGACNIREKVGLRPYRPGVRLQTELLARDGRRLPVVHHYGHGSGGISVHWGTALEAARLVSECVHALRTPIPKSKL